MHVALRAVQARGLLDERNYAGRLEVGRVTGNLVQDLFAFLRAQRFFARPPQEASGTELAHRDARLERARAALATGGTVTEIAERHELYRHDLERPILDPDEAFHAPGTVDERLERFGLIRYSSQSLEPGVNTTNVSTRMPPAVRVEARYEDASASLMQFVNGFDGRILFTSCFKNPTMMARTRVEARCSTGTERITCSTCAPQPG